jgi:hypothetical protein
MSRPGEETVVTSENDYGADASNILSARWGRRGVIASLLIGAGTLAVKSVSWFNFSPAHGGEYQVIAEWENTAAGRGLMIAISPDLSLEELRALGKRLQDRFRGMDDAAVMIFDDAEAALQVRKGSRNVDETRFQAALGHQRAMYLKSCARGVESLTVYKSYPVVSEVIRFDDDLRQTSR